MKAIVFGSTGALGRELVVQLLECKDFTQVIAVTRREIPESERTRTFPGITLKGTGQKLKVVQVNFEGGKEVVPLWLTLRDFLDSHTVAFCALGTTVREARTADARRRVDVEYVDNVAMVCKQYYVEHFSLVTAKGAKTDSWFDYLAAKGDIEDRVTQLGFVRTTIWRPGALERHALMRWYESLLALTVRLMPVATLAEALVNNALTPIQRKEKPTLEGPFEEEDIWLIAHPGSSEAEAVEASEQVEPVPFYSFQNLYSTFFGVPEKEMSSLKTDKTSQDKADVALL
ncbi:hypothetical protein CYMTET_18704 [Cymbomonas tetramitiformis]|uniref:NAD(P)-binding domain-containing protein n=1 Tax=Cymbomonas tetramitiformis TaxID=36881 RepID=A0AAE0G8V9_9CHLO|nr:hypothetical protein CYMTET_18704 [Cymbomonas tetramitiformis]|eukprot:gene12210-14421_t